LRAACVTKRYAGMCQILFTPSDGGTASSSSKDNVIEHLCRGQAHSNESAVWRAALLIGYGSVGAAASDAVSAASNWTSRAQSIRHTTTCSSRSRRVCHTCGYFQGPVADRAAARATVSADHSVPQPSWQQWSGLGAGDESLLHSEWAKVRFEGRPL
jgi:hypothetical protein